MHEKGLSQTVFAPDPAFYLERIDKVLPINFIEKNTVGINISPLITKLEHEKGLVVENVKKLIYYILENTDMNVALIPHVVWQHNDDRVPLREIWECFKNSEICPDCESIGIIKQKGIWICNECGC